MGALTSMITDTLQGNSNETKQPKGQHKTVADSEHFLGSTDVGVLKDGESTAGKDDSSSEQGDHGEKDLADSLLAELVGCPKTSQASPSRAGTSRRAGVIKPLLKKAKASASSKSSPAKSPAKRVKEATQLESLEDKQLEDTRDVEAIMCSIGVHNYEQKLAGLTQRLTVEPFSLAAIPALSRQASEKAIAQLKADAAALKKDRH